MGNALSWQAVIPASANSPGRFGAHYKTRVAIFNPTSRDYSIVARLYGTNGLISREDIAINSGRYIVWDNFLGQVFDYTGGGAVWLIASGEDDQFYMTAEVYTDSPNGRFSTTVVNGIIPAYETGGEPEFNVGISVNQNRRTNIGVWNWETKPSSVEAKVFDASAMLVETIGFELKGKAWQQKTISTPVRNGHVRWEINGESEAHYFYAVEVDNKSNDGTLTWSVKRSTASGGGLEGTEFVWVPPGEFMMGSTSLADRNEQPVTRVRISKGFYLGKYEVTQDEWQAVMGNNPSFFSGCGNCPVEKVSWNDVQAFIEKLNARSREGRYRLPTEAEWEYAARAGTTTDTYAGDVTETFLRINPVLNRIAWYPWNSEDRTHPVGGKEPNAFGLYDMLGNVWEWVQDRYGGYPGGVVTDPSGPDRGFTRVFRGGSWASYAKDCRSAARKRNVPESRFTDVGFRLVREE